LIIALLSDFGSRDTYVAEMKAVILGLCREATLVDITHEVERHNIRMGAYLLARAARIFPAGTAHLAVVDPGVGGGRRPILIEGKDAYFIGPDNGLLMPAAEEQGIRHVYKIERTPLLREQISNTFHGRDIFAPVAGHLAAGVRPSDFGPEIFDPKPAPFTEVEIGEGSLTGEVIHIDNFGNVVTNITPRHLGEVGVRPNSRMKVAVDGGGLEETQLLRTYSDVAPGSLLALVGSGGFLEFSVNQGDAAKLLKAVGSRRVQVTLV